MTIRNYLFGQITSDTVADGKHLSLSGATTKYNTFEEVIGTDYQVTTGKTLYLSLAIPIASTADTGFYLGYGDDAVNNSATPPTNAVQLMDLISVHNAYTPYEVPIFATIPADKYPYGYCAGGTLQVHVLGIEI